MAGDEYKIRIGKHKGEMLKDIPASYLIFMYDKGYLSLDKVAQRFVAVNYNELKLK